MLIVNELGYEVRLILTVTNSYHTTTPLAIITIINNEYKEVLQWTERTSLSTFISFCSASLNLSACCCNNTTQTTSYISTQLMFYLLISIYSSPRVGPGHASSPFVHLLPHLSPFLLFSFFHWLYLFSSFVHPFPFYQNSPTLFPGRRS